ncbi:MAG TPA: GrpB family protein [Ktedonobacteraceae bacterium]|nr:GrpB family protein [Ktedonobacteraceae bacterium]
MKMIKIVPYDENWPHEFAEIAGSLRATLGEVALRIDHIGSTAVPGLAAKDIIDVQVTVRDFDAPFEALLGSLGYILRLDINRDHLPPQVFGSGSEWEKRYFQPPEGQRPTNLHVRAQGRANQRYALLFRDYLRTHPVAAGAYAEIKRALAHYHPENWDAYYDIKDPVCDVIWSAAQEWARMVAWEPGPSDA